MRPVQRGELPKAKSDKYKQEEVQVPDMESVYVEIQLRFYGEIIFWTNLIL